VQTPKKRKGNTVKDEGLIEELLLTMRENSAKQDRQQELVRQMLSENAKISREQAENQKAHNDAQKAHNDAQNDLLKKFLEIYASKP
jgi:membrane-bound ClpP family serine protease